MWLLHRGENVLGNVLTHFRYGLKHGTHIERILMTRYADKYDKFVAYRELIQNVDVKYQWHAVSSYDM